MEVHSGRSTPLGAGFRPPYLWPQVWLNLYRAVEVADAQRWASSNGRPKAGTRGIANSQDSSRRARYLISPTSASSDGYLCSTPYQIKDDR